MLRSILVVVLAIVLVVGCTLAWLVFVPNAMKPLASYLVERITGHELVISGRLEIDPGLHLTITASGIELANAPWAAGDHLMIADALRLQLDLPALLDKEVNVLGLDVHNAQGWLEISEDGRLNLDFLTDDGEAAQNYPEDRWEFLIQGLKLNDVTIIATIGEIPPITLEVAEVIELTDPAEYLRFNGHGQLNGNPWRLAGDVGPLPSILVGQDVELDVDLSLDDLNISTSGVVGHLTDLSSADLDFSMRGPDASVWGELLGLADAFQGDVELTGRVEPMAGGLLFRSHGHIADYKVDLDGNIDDVRNLDGVEATFSFDGPDFSVVGLVLLIHGVPGGPFSISGKWRSFGADVELTDFSLITDFATVTGDVDFDAFPSLHSGSARLVVEGSDSAVFRELLGISSLVSGRFRVDATLDGSDGFVDVAAIIGNNHVAARGEVGPYPHLQGTRFTATVSGERFDDILQSLGTSRRISTSYTGSGKLEIEAERLSFTDLAFDLGPITAQGNAHIPLNQPGGFNVQAHYRLASLQQAGKMFGGDGLPDWQVEGSAGLVGSNSGIQIRSATAKANGLTLTAEGSLGKLPELTGLNLNLGLSGPSTNMFLPTAMREDRDYPFTISAQLSGTPDQWQIQNLIYRSQSAELRASGTLPSGGSLTGLTLAVQGAAPSLQRFFPGNAHYRPMDEAFQIDGGLRITSEGSIEVVNLELGIGSLQLSLNGSLDFGDHMKMDLDLEMHGNSLSEIGYINGARLPDRPFEIATSLRSNENEIDISNLAARWGNSDLDGNISILLREVPEIVVKGRSKHLSVKAFQDLLPESPQKEQAETDLKIFSSDPIPFAQLRDLSVDVDLQIEKFSERLLNFDDVSISLILRDGALQVDQFQFSDEVGTFSAVGSLTPTVDSFDFTARINGQDAALGLFTSDAQDADSVPRYTLDIDLTSRGKSVAEIAGNMNGTVLLHSDGGQIANNLIDALGGDFLANLLDTLFPIEEPSPYTQMECAVFKASVADGVLNFKPGFTARTPRVDAFVFGKVDLRNERLDLSFATRARTGIAISAGSIINPYFKVGGTLTSPQLELDTANAAVAYSVAVATAGFSIILRGFLDRLMGEKSPCDRFLKAKY